MKEAQGSDRQASLFKFKELKAYSSTEWLANNRKKYRQVFERGLTSYIYAELSLYNKMYDKESWEIDIDIKCFEVLKSDRLVCDLQFKKKVSKYDPIVYLREGWGNKKIGVFWKKGTYYWEAWINGKKVGTKYFYVEDAGSETQPTYLNYFNIQNIRLYEGPYEDIESEDRVYLSEFNRDQTRYAYVELLAVNKLPNIEWNAEVFVRFYNNARELKGEVSRLSSVNKGDHEFVMTAGWGSNAKGSWRDGTYTIEVVCHDHLIASVDLVISDEMREGIPRIHFTDADYDDYQEIEDPYEGDFETIMDRLNGYIGLESIKKQVREHAQYIQFLQLRKDKGFEDKESLDIHSVFTGNPGTGKTTIAKMMGALYHKMGLLKSGHVHEVDRVDLIGEYIGQTAPKVKAAIDKAKGGILFIDEAYSLSRSSEDSKDFGKEVIEILVKAMSNKRQEFAVIVAGYPKEMKNMIESNPGLKSRFKHFFEFKDYTPQELSQIAEVAAIEKGIHLTDTAKEYLDMMITKAYRDRDRTFGNARYVHDILDKSMINLGVRIMSRKFPEKSSKTDLAQISINDIKAIQSISDQVKPNIAIDEELLKISLAELDGLIGINNIKEEIRDLVRIVRFYKDSGKDVLQRFFLHTVFVGNPGTGKTTIARILTRIYAALGILERGHIVETDRQGLIAGFVGQTAIKTSERIDEALGGVLFIDEAYALSNFNGLQGDYGNEAIQTILKRMEDDRGQFFVFAAGYPDNMEVFLKANPGLSSRFDKVLRFEDYNASELLQIAIKMLKDEGYKIKAQAKAALAEKLYDLYEKRDKYFGNARAVRKVISELIQIQNLRLAEDKILDESVAIEISLLDVSMLKSSVDQKTLRSKGIGFN